MSFLRLVYRRPCVDHEGLRNPVEQWLADGGRYHRKRRRRISVPAEVLPRWHVGIEAGVRNPVHRDLLLFGLYTGMRRGEIMPLRQPDGRLLRCRVTCRCGGILRRADGGASMASEPS